MDSEKYRRASELFDQARQLPPRERGSFLDEASLGDAELRAEVESLLRHHEEAEGFLAESPLRAKLNLPAAAALDSAGAFPSPGSRAEQVPTGLGEFQIIRELGRGGMGVVYEARHTPLDRCVALKVLPQVLLADQKTVERFAREAKVAAQLHHPNIVQVYQTGTEAGTPYFAMELVAGKTLEQILDKFRPEETQTKEAPERLGQTISSLSEVLHMARSGGEPSSRSCQSSDKATRPSSPASQSKLDLKKSCLDYCRQLAEVFAGAADGLHYAHSNGVIHRDIKPSNLILDQAGRLRILDFGLARLEGVERLTLTQEFLGTPLYVSPEQARSGKVPADKRTDIYSLGVTLYEMLVLRPPFRGDSHHDTLDQVIHKDPPPLRRFHPQMCRDLEAIVLKCLEKEPERRYASAAELAEDLRRWRRGETVSAQLPTLGYLLRLFVARHRAAVLSVALVVLVFACSLTYWILSLREARREAQDHLAQVLRLSDVKRLNDCVAEADQLWPAMPDKIPDMENWLKRVEDLTERLDAHEESIAALRGKALPYDDAMKAHDRATHPRAAELQELKEEKETALEEARRLEKSDPGKEATLLSYGDDPNKKHSSYYFRRAFEVEAPEAFEKLHQRLAVNDGAVIYLNGKEILRVNMPRGEVQHETLAAENASGEKDKSRLHVVSEEDRKRLIRRGRNVLAVEVHLASAASSDVHFDLELLGRVAGKNRSILNAGSAWRFHEGGGAPPQAWKEPEFDDSTWPKGPAPLGYGFEEGPGRVAELRQRATRLHGMIAEVEDDISQRRTWRFLETELQWRHDTQAELVKGLKALGNQEEKNGLIASVKKRLEFARTVYQKTVQDHEDAWDRAIHSISDERECPLYKGLRIPPQVGLIPIGRVPDSGLWEFAHLQSGKPPERDADGKLILTEEMGLVFVLLPGGTFQMGAARASLGVRCAEVGNKLQIGEVSRGSFGETLGVETGDVLVSVNAEEVKTLESLEAVLGRLYSGSEVSVLVDRGGERKTLRGELGPNVDPQAWENESPVHEVTLAPFFLSKYEMTQGQWLRFAGKNPSAHAPGRKREGREPSLLHPVEDVSWGMCADVFRKLGLVLPTEAQWEYACRAGTNTVWWTGDERESLKGKVNLADRTAARIGMRWEDIKEWPELDDGYAQHAPVGTYAPNAFGLHEVHGNLWEWCRDWHGPYSLQVRPGDGERRVPRGSARIRVFRGGSARHAARWARSAQRNFNSPELRSAVVGVRPARIVSSDPPVRPPLAGAPVSQGAPPRDRSHR